METFRVEFVRSFNLMDLRMNRLPLLQLLELAIEKTH